MPEEPASSEGSGDDKDGSGGEEGHRQNGSGGAGWMLVRNLPSDAKGHAWFKRYSSVGEVKKASFYGFRTGQVRWAMCKCTSAAKASALAKELNGKAAGGEQPLVAKAITAQERQELAKQGTKERHKETADGRTTKRSTSPDRKRSRSRSRRHSGCRHESRQAQPPWKALLLPPWPAPTLRRSCSPPTSWSPRTSRSRLPTTPTLPRRGKTRTSRQPRPSRAQALPPRDRG
mmetsp:Transcript_65349/g.202595  ORF Transcript_65349/g.202595 Transcript_65349/m.202595 type:complete len:231 (+) Transcript_65349:155-847(+)